MSNQVKEKMMKAAPNRWFTFCILVFSGGVAFKMSSIKDMFYVPMQEFMGLSNTQIGAGLSAYGIVQTIGLIAGLYICDRFSKKYMISFSLFAISISGLYLATFPGYYGFLAIFAVLAFFGEVTYWPVLLKAVKLTGTEKDQGRMFGFLEMGRGIVDVIIASSAVALFGLMGETPAALRAGFIFLSAVIFVAGILCFIFIPNDVMDTRDKDGNEIGKNKAALFGMMEALKSVEIWAVALNGFMVYCVYCGLTYFIPFLSTIYGLPAVMLGFYGIANQYGLKMIGGPVGGFLSDKVHHSATKHIRGGFVVAAAAMVLFMLIPHEALGASGNYMVGMACTLGFGAIIFTMRAVFFAPMDEVRVRPQITGAAMSLGCLIIYLPNTFAYVLYGSLLDKYPGMEGFRKIFMLMIGFCVIGFFVSSWLVRIIRKKQQAETLTPAA
ncbi:MAG: MFS transporter [Oscillibacter sp.]